MQQWKEFHVFYIPLKRFFMLIKTLLLLIFMANLTVHAQQKTILKYLHQADRIMKKDDSKPEVMLLGIFHFAGEQVDENTTPKELRVNMLSDDRQEQIRKLVVKLSRFKPTKIAIEISPSREKYYDSLYAEYSQGRGPRGKRLDVADETFQVGFRLAKLLGHQKLYPVDAQSFRFHLNKQDSLLTYEKFKDFKDTSSVYWAKRYDAEQRFQDTLRYRLPLNRYLQYLNSPEKRASSIGRWLLATRKGDNLNPIGADGFITRYFNRNVRIYSNIQRITTSKNDRILVIYGATHMYMLEEIFRASPEYRIRDIMKYLR